MVNQAAEKKNSYYNELNAIKFFMQKKSYRYKVKLNAKSWLYNFLR